MYAYVNETDLRVSRIRRTMNAIMMRSTRLPPTPAIIVTVSGSTVFVSSSLAPGVDKVVDISSPEDAAVSFDEFDGVKSIEVDVDAVFAPTITHVEIIN